MSSETPASGLIHAYLLDGKGGGRQLDDAAVDNWTAADGVLWLHFDFTHPSTYLWLRDKSGLPEVATDALTVLETRPRIISINDGLMIALRGVNMNPGEDPEDMVSVRIWTEQDRVITTRRRHILAIQDIRAAIDNGEGPTDSGDFLADLIGRLASRIGDFVDRIEDRLLDAEENVSEDADESTRRELAATRRQIANVRRFVAPQRDALDRLYRNPGTWIPEADIQLLREEADRITRYVEDLDLARERAIVLHEEYLSSIAQQQNSRMYVLSIVAAIFLPLTFVTGLLGMNVGGLPGIDSDHGFLISVMVMLVCGVLVAAILRLKRWM
jgi:zinc transporter